MDNDGQVLLARRFKLSGEKFALEGSVGFAVGVVQAQFPHRRHPGIINRLANHPDGRQVVSGRPIDARKVRSLQRRGQAGGFVEFRIAADREDFLYSRRFRTHEFGADLFRIPGEVRVRVEEGAHRTNPCWRKSAADEGLRLRKRTNTSNALSLPPKARMVSR